MSTETVRRTTEVASHISRGCEHCGHMVGGGLGDEPLADDINHYITEHGYRLLHIGTQTNHDNEGKPWHNTVAILGHDDPPAVQEPPKVEIGHNM